MNIAELRDRLESIAAELAEQDVQQVQEGSADSLLQKMGMDPEYFPGAQMEPGNRPNTFDISTPQGERVGTVHEMGQESYFIELANGDDYMLDEEDDAETTLQSMYQEINGDSDMDESVEEFAEEDMLEFDDEDEEEAEKDSKKVQKTGSYAKRIATEDELDMDEGIGDLYYEPKDEKDALAHWLASQMKGIDNFIPRFDMNTSAGKYTARLVKNAGGSGAEGMEKVKQALEAAQEALRAYQQDVMSTMGESVEESKTAQGADGPWYQEQRAKELAEKDGKDWSRMSYGDKEDYRAKVKEMSEETVEETVEVPVAALAELMQLAGYANYADKLAEYENEPEEEYMDIEDQVIGLSGGLNRPKKMHPAVAGGDNPMDQEPRKVEEDESIASFEGALYKSYKNFLEEQEEKDA